MGREKRILESPQGAFRLERFPLENVETGSADAFLTQRIGQRLLIDHLAAPDIHEVGVWPHGGDLRASDHAMGRGGGRQRDRNEIALTQNVGVAFGAVPALRNSPLGVADTW